MLVLGISAFYHDSAISLIRDNTIIFAVQEERFTRIKNDKSFPIESIKSCIEYCNLAISEIDAFVFYENHLIKFDRLMNSYLDNAPKGFNFFKSSFPTWIKEKLNMKKFIISELCKINNDKKIYKDKIFFSKHHFSHASSAFYPSPFNDSNILVVDGVGEWSTTSVSHGHNKNIKILDEIKYPHSLGLLYSTFTSFLGFKVNSGEYKLMGLAPYGENKYLQLILDNLINLKDDGSFELNLEYFDFTDDKYMFNQNFISLFGFNNKLEEEAFNQNHLDFAKSIQECLEIAILKLCRKIKNYNLSNNLCLAGGVALNCVANGKIIKEKIFDNIWIQPASGDAGGSLGAALAYYYSCKKDEDNVNKPLVDSMKNSLLGPSYEIETIKEVLESKKINYTYYENENELLIEVSKNLNDKKIIGWFQGRMEFGPRALGARSILADPRDKEMQKNLNLKIKFREGFRPFAPIILEDHAKNLFQNVSYSPYMLITDEVKSKKNYDILLKTFGLDKLNVVKSEYPATTHVDYSSRLQTVNSSNGKIFKLLERFFEDSGCPLLINTSFNVRGEPIICTPKDALECFFGTNMDILVIENYFIYKSRNEGSINMSFKSNFEKD